MSSGSIISPYGGELKLSLVDEARAAELKAASQDWPSHTLDAAGEAELELLLNGAYSPLSGYMSQADYETVIDHSELADGTYWPEPVSLSLSAETADALSAGGQLVLRDPELVILAIVNVTDIWQVGDEWRVGGSLEGLQLPQHYDNAELRLTPAQVRAKLGDKETVAFQSATPLSAWQTEQLETVSGLLLLANIDVSDPAMDCYALARCYQHSAATTNSELCLLNSSGQSAELMAIVARNYGSSTWLAHTDNPLAEDAAERIGIKIGQIDSDPSALPDWREREYPEAIEREIHQAFPPKSSQGLTVFCTGLSGSGKSTIARVLLSKLQEKGGRRVTLLDGDHVRQTLSSELTFSKEHRNLNILRIGYVASEITNHGGIALCAPIAPYAEVRDSVRATVEATGGGFVLVHVATTLEECEARDRKGLYAKARAGIIPEFTGISDPYEEPENAEVVLTTAGKTPEECAQEVMLYLEGEGYFG